jgi:hypothetical protein
MPFSRRETLGISEAFAGLDRCHRRNAESIGSNLQESSRHAVSVIRTALADRGLFPMLLLLSFVLGRSILTFVLSPLWWRTLAAIVSAIVVFDGESSGSNMALIGLYCIIAACWWG